MQRRDDMSNITRFDPFNDLVDDLFKGFLVRPMGYERREAVAPRMKVDVAEKNGAYLVTAEIPGVKKEDIHVDVEGDHVSVRAEVKQEKEEKKGEKVIYSERSYGMVSRSFTLPVDVDAQGAKADYKDGMLNLVLPKKAGASTKQITVS
jgi:HSP20 family protein